jgi:hypothetical protein
MQRTRGRKKQLGSSSFQRGFDLGFDVEVLFKDYKTRQNKTNEIQKQKKNAFV